MGGIYVARIVCLPRTVYTRVGKRWEDANLGGMQISGMPGGSETKLCGLLRKQRHESEAAENLMKDSGV